MLRGETLQSPATLDLLCRQRIHFIALVSLLLCAQAPTSAQDQSAEVVRRSSVLQACPAVEEEVVDLELLKSALRGSDAVGFLEKLRLKSSIDDLIDRMQAFHNGRRNYSLMELQEQYDVLLMRIAVHLEHKDTILHAQLCNAWDMIWQDLEDPVRFAEKFA